MKQRLSWHTRKWPTRTLLVAAACAGLGCLVATYGHAAPPPPRVMGVVPSAAGPRLMPLDARTLAPVRGGWSRSVGTAESVALSPSGARIAVATAGGKVLVLDTATGRVVRKYSPQGVERLYWLGGNGTRGSRLELLVAASFGCWSLGCGYEYEDVRSDSGMTVGITGEPIVALRDGLVIQYDGDPTMLVVFGPDYGFGDVTCIELLRMQKDAPFAVVADVAHDRLFAISSAGLVAEIDRVRDLDRPPRVRYHRVDLNGRPFEAAWAGAGRIALWGRDGLGTIDTRTWKTRTVAPGVTGAIATRFGLAAWTDDPADGLTVYRPDGQKRLHVLAGKPVDAAQTVGGYLYVDADALYSIDLRTGRVLGPLRSDAMIITPTLVSIP
jgi:hypothetical protein